MQVSIKKNGIHTLDEVYRMIGIKKQHISYWQKHPASTQTKSRLKQKTIIAAGKLFHLSDAEIESLANQAGFSFCSNENFPMYFGTLITKYSGKQKQLYDDAQISERMFRYIKKGSYLKKESVLSLAIALGLDLEGIQTLMKKAGFFLSKSLPNDVVIMWMLENGKRENIGISQISYINEVLYSLELPLLMTREKISL